MSVMLPYRRSRRLLLGLFLVDLPVFVAAAVCGVWFGFARTFEAISEWRLHHPVSLLPSLLLAVLLVARWERSR